MCTAYARDGASRTMPPDVATYVSSTLALPQIGTVSARGELILTAMECAVLVIVVKPSLPVIVPLLWQVRQVRVAALVTTIGMIANVFRCRR